LPNGNAQQTSEASVEEQPKQPATVNGKIKRMNNKISLTPAPAPATKPSAPTSAPPSTPTSISAEKDEKHVTDTVEPPKKRPKLKLKEKIKPLTPPKANAVVPDEDEIEDISDEAYIVRHQRALIEERRRFETYLRFPWSTRSRANRRVDSRAESSGANTPDPASPAAPQLSGAIGADNESIPSPLAQSLLQNPLDGVNADGEPTTAKGTTKGKRQERRRTTSSKLKESDRRSATPDTLLLAQISIDAGIIQICIIANASRQLIIFRRCQIMIIIVFF